MFCSVQLIPVWHRLLIYCKVVV